MSDYNLVCLFENVEGVPIMVDLRTVQAVAAAYEPPGYSLFDMGAGVVLRVSGKPADIQLMARGLGVELKIVEPIVEPPFPPSGLLTRKHPPSPAEDPNAQEPPHYEI